MATWINLEIVDYYILYVIKAARASLTFDCGVSWNIDQLAYNSKGTSIDLYVTLD